MLDLARYELECILGKQRLACQFEGLKSKLETSKCQSTLGFTALVFASF